MCSCGGDTLLPRVRNSHLACTAEPRLPLSLTGNLTYYSSCFDHVLGTPCFQCFSLKSVHIGHTAARRCWCRARSEYFAREYVAAAIASSNLHEDGDEDAPLDNQPRRKRPWIVFG
jgi:hypothetical protein